MADGMAIFAPNANSYRRFQRESYVPMQPSWGVNNRGVAVRIPHSDAANRRLEHRVAGADANPYLVMAYVLAGMLHGLEQQLQPGKQWSAWRAAQRSESQRHNRCRSPDAL